MRFLRSLVPRRIGRLCDACALRALEADRLRRRFDWEGMRKVLERFRPVTAERIYLNQVWGEWRGFLEFVRSRGAPRRIVEIGTGRGGSTYFLSKLGGRGSVLVTVDVDASAGDYVALFRRESAQVIACVTGDSHAPETVRAVRERLRGGPADLLYIDGDHAYEGVKRDFELYRRLCGEEGLVVLHDIHPDYRYSRGVPTSSYSGEVHRFWREVKASHRHIEFVGSPDQDGFGIGVVLDGGRS